MRTNDSEEIKKSAAKLFTCGALYDFSFWGENFENYSAVVVAAAFFFDLIKQTFYQKELPILLVNSAVFSRHCVHFHRVFHMHALRKDDFQKPL